METCFGVGLFSCLAFSWRLRAGFHCPAKLFPINLALSFILLFDRPHPQKINANDLLRDINRRDSLVNKPQKISAANDQNCFIVVP